ncbi:hypothetical protein XM38_032860 [Halomicronema hongdechloris C2206]|uniref:Phage protein D n=1 Tax=Halomicronema hongdechloris C2206 TaxID=1641165 RepID=A0A1Z3HPU4_9CYAN|nr:hypothetical protein [Halomicronema hongdechloris]ASC72329.1 hypothetical protein XM38_032860 [Halomicronema hongdechloris C2206]
MLAPSFSITLGSVTSTTATPIGGPTALTVERDMDIPTDGLRLQLSDRVDINLGEAVVVNLGHDGEEETVFTGTVITLRPSLAGVELRAIGKLNQLLTLRTAAQFEDQSAGSIAQDLIDQAGLTAGTVDQGPVLPRYTVDQRLSGFAHLRNLADRLGYELYGDRQGQVQFHALGAVANLDSGLGGIGGAVTALTGGGAETYQFWSAFAGCPGPATPPTWGAIAIGGESPMSRQGDTTAHWLTTNTTDHRGEAGTGASSLLLLDPVARTQDLANRIAAGRWAIATRRLHEISFTVLGRPQVELGDTLTIRGNADDLLNQGGYVRALRHRVSKTLGFVTDLRIAVEVAP